MAATRLGPGWQPARPAPRAAGLPPRAAARAASGMVERTAPPAASRGLHRRRGQPTSGGMHMPGPQVEAKVSQYLNEAQATEQALIQTLQAHIAMTPRGSYREVLEGHLE